MQPRTMQAFLGVLSIIGFVVIVSMIWFPGTLSAETVSLTAQWSPYQQGETPATGLKLIRNTKPATDGHYVIAPNISPDSTQIKFIVDIQDGDTLYFAMQGVNRDLNPARFSELSPWTMWTYKKVVPPPGPITGFGIVAVEVVIP